MNDLLRKIYDYSLEEIMGDRFGRYCKTIIQDRAIPDVRDGLKPVQRRILYSMYKEKNTYDKPYRKSARSVGDIMGKYHPHGDSSIYDAMVRMSQNWKMKTMYIDMHGNNGSVDGDSPAAMRYTEARLSKISEELLKDIDKDTVIFAPTYDDSSREPTVLPARFPNLLVNGATGISAGYATNIPPHNLGEVIDATVKRIENPNCHLETILDIVKGPDFPTGAIACGKDGIRSAYESGRGRVVIKSTIVYEKNKGKDQIIITEIPYETNKAMIVKRIDEIRVDKKIEGILEVRDESDRTGLRIAIDIKKDADREIITNYLLKNTDLQIAYNMNMIAIANRRPKLLGILAILDAYIDHQKEVIIKRTQFDLDHFKLRLHIVEGLIKAISILDEVVALIRKSKNKTDAKDNLVKVYAFTEVQAEAIVMLQLYKLTNTDVTLLEEEMNNLKTIIKGLEEILASDEILKDVMKNELKQVKKEYAKPRQTIIEDEIVDIKIDSAVMIPKEDVIVVITNEGYAKRVSTRSYTSVSDEDTTLKDSDYVIGLYELCTLDTVLLFTSKGNYLYVPVHEIKEAKWKEVGKHISSVITIADDERIIGSMPITNFDTGETITLFTKFGMIKKTLLSDFKVQRYSKPITAVKLKDDDELISVTISNEKEIFVVTNKGYGLWFDANEVPVVGIKTSGVKSINLKDDYVVSGIVFNKNSDHVSLITNKGNAKRIKILELEKSSRAKRGILVIREIKTNPQSIVKAFITDPKSNIGLISNGDIKMTKTTDYPIADRYSAGSTITKQNITDAYLLVEIEKRIAKEKKIEIDEIIDDEEIIEPKKDVSLNELDDYMLTIDVFLDDSEYVKSVIQNITLFS